MPTLAEVEEYYREMAKCEFYSDSEWNRKVLDLDLDREEQDYIQANETRLIEAWFEGMDHF